MTLRFLPGSMRRLSGCVTAKHGHPTGLPANAGLMGRLFVITISLGLMLATAKPPRGVAEEPSRDVEYRTPEAVFAAYKKATNDHDWKTLFSLGTTAHQNARLMNFAIGAAFSEEDPMHHEEIRTYRAILAKHGIDWRQVRQLAADAEAGKSKSGFLIQLERVVDRSTGKAELFSAVSDFLAKRSDPTSVFVDKMQNLAQNGSVARCDSLETSIVIERTTDDLTKTTKERRVEVKVTSHLFFHRFDGSWHLDVEEGEK